MNTTERETFLERWRQSRARTRAMIDAVNPGMLDFKPGEETRSIRDTIVHMLACQSTVVTGLRSGEFPWKDDVARYSGLSLDVALELARDLDGVLARTVREAGESWFSEVPAGQRIDRRQWLWESLEHEVHHTGQLAMMIRLAGGEPARIFD